MLFICILQLSCRIFYYVEVQCHVLLPSCFAFQMRRPWKKCACKPCVTSVEWEWQKRQGWSGREVHLWGLGSLCFMASLPAPVVLPLLWLWCVCLSGHLVNMQSTLRFSSAAPPHSGTFMGANGLHAGSCSLAWEAVQICTICTRWSSSPPRKFLEPKVWRLACFILCSDSWNKNGMGRHVRFYCDLPNRTCNSSCTKIKGMFTRNKSGHFKLQMLQSIFVCPFILCIVFVGISKLFTLISSLHFWLSGYLTRILNNKYLDF